MEVDWNAVSAIATVGATLVALGFGVRDFLRRRSDQKERGEVALAMAFPELARVNRGLAKMLEIIGALRRGERAADTDAIIELSGAAEFTRGWLETAGFELFLDMPRQVRMNLPSAIRGLDLVRSSVPEVGRARTQNLDELHKTLDYLEAFVRGCAVDIHAALQYINEHINPKQHENVKGVTLPGAPR